MTNGQRGAWLLAAAVCAAMLVLPALFLWLAPRPAIPARQAPRAAKTEPTRGEVSAPPPRPEVRATRPRHTARVAPEGGAVITGVVLDPDGKPMAGASVVCDDRAPAPSASTGDDGRFQLDVDADGCLAVSRHASFIASDRTRLVAGRENVLQLNRGGAVSGEVVDERGAPVTTYALAIESYRGAAEPSPHGSKTIDDVRGAFLWEGLAAGAYVFTAGAEGRPPARSAPIDVELGRTTHHVRIVLPAGARLSGRILDADTRRPLAGATIALDGATFTSVSGVRPARSDDSGGYALDGAPPGPFSIRVSHDGYVSKVVAGLMTRGAASLQQDVELRTLGDGGSRSEHTGIGATLLASSKGVGIGSLLPGGGAEQVGLRVGDIFKRIDGVDAASFPITECIQRLRGPEGSVVSVQVERGREVVEVSIVRRSYLW